MIKGAANSGRIEAEFLIESLTLGTTSAGKPFARMKLRNDSGTAEGVIWDYDEVGYNGVIAAGKVVMVAGTISLYNGEHQVKIASAEPGVSEPSKYQRGSQYNVESLYDSVMEVINGFTEELTKVAALGLLARFPKKDILAAPAATTVHNNWAGGLLEHVHSMLSIGENVAKHYKNEYYPTLSVEKVLFGIIAHDICKIREYDVNNPAYPKTTAGVLVNHIVLGPAMVYNIMAEHFAKSGKAMTKDDLLEVYHLMHLIASHHGVLEWGSPVKPSTIEAVILHHLDNLDSKVLHAVKLLEEPDGTNPMLSKYSKFEGVQYVKL
jgi:3'-5' exoribonuclease